MGPNEPRKEKSDYAATEEMMTEQKETDIKFKINELLFEILPGNVTLAETDDVACNIWGKIMDIWNEKGESK